MAGDSSDITRPRPVLSKFEEKEPQCSSPITPLSFSKFSIDTEWGEMEDYDVIAGGPVCASPAMSSPGSYGFSSPTGLSQAWFDVRVIYVRITGCSPEEDPDSLTIRFPPRTIGVTLEVNGGWISPTEESCVVLRRDRVDSETAEATYVSTDNLRICGTICYEVVNKEEVIVSGTLEHVENCLELIHGSKECFSKKDDQAWAMECRCVAGNSGCFFNKSRQDFSASLLPPTMEVSMVGRHMNVPVFITQTVRLIARRKSSRVLTLDVIPETEELGKSHNGMILVDEPQLVSFLNLMIYISLEFVRATIVLHGVTLALMPPSLFS